MIKKFDFEKAAKDNPFLNAKRSDQANELAELQRACIERNLPVLIIIDGWESAGKGYTIKQLVRELDARHFKVDVFEAEDADAPLHPYSWRFWTRIPARGDFAIFDRSFYYRVMNDPDIQGKKLKTALKHFERVEKMLTDDGMLILKFFLNVTEKTQRERIQELLKDENRDVLISKNDQEQNAHYKKYRDHFDEILEMTNLPFSPWWVIAAEDKKAASRQILGITIQEIRKQIQSHTDASEQSEPAFSRSYGKAPEILQKLRTDLVLSDEEYDQAVGGLQDEADELLFALYARRIPSIMVFEGMDAAGKGGAIQRLTQGMDPRLYEINPTAAPSDPEKDHHYLWRFYTNFPTRGRMAVFDRSWYGRVMVERVEGFAKPEEWERAYDEINAMEEELTDFGALVLKFFLYIDSQEQLERFRERETDKPYKLTEEDWRNREKWDDYVEAMNEMIDRTSPPSAPWVLVEGNDKRFARVKVLESFIRAAKARLK